MNRIRFSNEKTDFLVKNILKGFFFLAILVLIFYLLRKGTTEEDRMLWFGSIYNNPMLVLAVFVASEIIFGIIPPEIFMLWSMETGYFGPYFISIGTLSLISYAAGFLNFTIGKFLKGKVSWLNGENKFLKKYQKMFDQYGGYLVIVASVTPIPFSAVSLLAGAGGLDKTKYLLNSLFRILRYFVYAYILWQVEV
ncbi:VTT domain-containing protein [Aquiflexum sp. LQ15W]|uniref:YqaA family protein n=1 Tax=Cognataquiflexum nitidum TaxID=2922272 RepID=UPI001F140A2D|nr:VTT domain-containing protein [Cognataquiflexum nitidum]MCH6199591.1 VTT domain-containing protein [Cognataquiflexum nitidum]